MVSPAQSKLIEAALIPARVASEVSSSVAAKTLDAARQQGAQVVSLIDKAGQIGAGDALVAKATGKGGLLDVHG
jgi:hypothetical protein